MGIGKHRLRPNMVWMVLPTVGQHWRCAAGRRLLLSGFEAKKERRAHVRQIAEHGGTILQGIPRSPVRSPHLRIVTSCPE